MHKHESTDYQRLVGNFVRHEVGHCVSFLVSELAKGFESAHTATTMAEAFELCTPIDDWEEAAIQEGWQQRKTPDGEDYFASEDDESTAESWQELCEEHDIEPYQREIFEHWIVSGWLAEKLAAKGERIGELAGLTIWGRTTTGQGIAMDSVICEIYDELGR